MNFFCLLSSRAMSAFSTGFLLADPRETKQTVADFPERTVADQIPLRPGEPEPAPVEEALHAPDLAGRRPAEVLALLAHHPGRPGLPLEAKRGLAPT